MTSFAKIRSIQRRIVKNERADPNVREEMYRQLLGSCRVHMEKGESRPAAGALNGNVPLCDECLTSAKDAIAKADATKQTNHTPDGQPAKA